MITSPGLGLNLFYFIFQCLVLSVRVIMASSRPAPFVIDDDDDWGTFSPPASSLGRSASLLSSRSSASSGEYNVFSAVGSSVAGGGITRELWFLDVNKHPCLGKVGVAKFCAKECEKGKTSCGTVRHVSKFSVKRDGAYIHASENQVFCAPCLELGGFSDSQRAKLLSLSKTTAEWNLLIKSLTDGDVPEWLEESESKTNDVDDLSEGPGSLQLLSPMASDAKHGVFLEFPNFSFDSESSENMETEEVVEGESAIAKKLVKLEQRVSVLKLKLARPFTDIEASYALVVADIGKINERLKALLTGVGPPVAVEGRNQVPVWSAIKGLYERFTLISNEKIKGEHQVSEIKADCVHLKDMVHSALEEISELQETNTYLQSWMQSTDSAINVFQKRFQSIKPLLNRISTSQESRTNLAQDKGPSLYSSSCAVDNHEEILCKMRDLEEKIKLLENRVVGAGVQMGNFVFQSFEDLLAWVRVKIPKGRFGLIVDGHSFLEFFTLSGHIDTEAGTTAFSHSQKAGFTSYIEAQLAISFKNLFPVVFGKGGASNIDDSECLPAISNGDKWNNGSTGIHHQLMRNMNDVSYQLDSSIKKVFKDYPEARQLATDCVTSSKRFVIDLISFMSQEYSTWQQRGFTKKDAWQIVCQIVRRIFEDLQSARISARNVQDFEDAEFTTASFIYATLKCHDVMEGYVRHQFHAHPHVSSVITRHLAANFVKPDASQDAKQNNLESKVKALATKVDSHESKLKLLVDKVKKGKAKNGTEDP